MRQPPARKNKVDVTDGINTGDETSCTRPSMEHGTLRVCAKIWCAASHVLDGYEVLHDVFKENANTKARNARCPPKTNLSHDGLPSPLCCSKSHNRHSWGCGHVHPCCSLRGHIHPRFRQHVQKVQKPQLLSSKETKMHSFAQVHHRHLHGSASAPSRRSCSHSRRRRRCRAYVWDSLLRVSQQRSPLGGRGDTSEGRTHETNDT